MEARQRQLSAFYHPSQTKQNYKFHLFLPWIWEAQSSPQITGTPTIYGMILQLAADEKMIIKQNWNVSIISVWFGNL